MMQGKDYSPTFLGHYSLVAHMCSSFLLGAFPVEKTLCVAYVPSAVTSCRGVADGDRLSSSVDSPACFLISESTIGICTK